jgi:hypothetical protein
MTKVSYIAPTDKYNDSYRVNGARIDHVSISHDGLILRIDGIDSGWNYYNSAWYDDVVWDHTVAGQRLYDRIHTFNAEHITEVSLTHWSWRKMRMVTKTVLGLKLDRELKGKADTPFSLESNCYEVNK